MVIIPNSPQHSHHGGHQKRSGGVVKLLATHLIQQSGMPYEFRNTAYAVVVYLLNRRPRRTREWKSPLEMLNNRLRSNLLEWRHLDQIKSLKAYVVTKERLLGKHKRLQPKAHIGYLVGFVSSTQYPVWVPSLGKAPSSTPATSLSMRANFINTRKLKQRLFVRLMLGSCWTMQKGRPKKKALLRSSFWPA